MPNLLTTPTNVSSPISAAGPSAYPTTLESTLDVVTEQPTSQMNEPDVTPDLFSPTISGPTSIFEIPKPTTIPETPYKPTIFETPMDRTPAPQSAQPSSDRLRSERKTREDSPPHRRYQHAQRRLDDQTKMTSQPTLFDESGDDDKEEEPTNISAV